MPGKPKVKIDQDGDGTDDVVIDVDVPTTPPVHEWPAGVRERINMLVGRMEVHISPPTQRVTYAAAREELRDILENNA